MGRFRTCGTCVAVVMLASLFITAASQAEMPIEPERLPAERPDLIQKLDTLKQDGRLMSVKAIVAALEHPTPAAVQLPPVATAPVRPAAIAAGLRKSVLRIGWYYLCSKCNDWHLNFAGGYLLNTDGVGATCHHVLADPYRAREGYVFALDYDGNIHPITEVLAVDEGMDTVVFKIDMAGAKDLVPLAINDQTLPGEQTFLLSDPSGVSGYFSEGIINRFYWQGDKLSGDPMALTDARSLRMDVSTDWAPGSSGSPVVDDRGNVVGHVSRISAIMSEPQFQPGPRAAKASGAPGAARMRLQYIPNTQVVLHEAIPSRCARLLIEAMNASTADVKLVASSAVGK